MEDKSKLFRDIPEAVYDDVMRRLQEMRTEHPYYRDDQLLMYMLCEIWGIPETVGCSCGTTPHHPACSEYPAYLEGQ